MFKVIVTYPSRGEELAILDRMISVKADLEIESALGPDELTQLRECVDGVYVDPKIKNYILDLVQATRRPGDFHLDMGPLIQFGASPRATIFLARAAKGNAFLEGRSYVTPHDVKAMAIDVLRHRILMTFEAEAEEVSAESVLQTILDRLPVP